MFHETWDVMHDFDSYDPLSLVPGGEITNRSNEEMETVDGRSAANTLTKSAIKL